jgi:hypothetical protein
MSSDFAMGTKFSLQFNICRAAHTNAVIVLWAIAQARPNAQMLATPALQRNLETRLQKDRTTRRQSERRGGNIGREFHPLKSSAFHGEPFQQLSLRLRVSNNQPWFPRCPALHPCFLGV